MKTFDDLNIHELQDSGFRGTLVFDNGYGVSVVKTRFSYGGPEGFYELAVVDSKYKLTYNTPVTSDVEGWLTKDAVTKLMKQVQELPKDKT